MPPFSGLARVVVTPDASDPSATVSVTLTSSAGSTQKDFTARVDGTPTGPSKLNLSAPYTSGSPFGVTLTFLDGTTSQTLDLALDGSQTTGGQVSALLTFAEEEDPGGPAREQMTLNTDMDFGTDGNVTLVIHMTPLEQSADVTSIGVTTNIDGGAASEASWSSYTGKTDWTGADSVHVVLEYTELNGGQSQSMNGDMVISGLAASTAGIGDITTSGS